MMRKRGAGHLEHRSDLTRAQAALLQALEDRAPGRIGQRAEDLLLLHRQRSRAITEVYLDNHLNITCAIGHAAVRRWNADPAPCATPGPAPCQMAAPPDQVRGRLGCAPAGQ